MLRAARFDAGLYAELRTDPIAKAQALTVMVLVLVASVLGSVIYAVVGGLALNRAFVEGLLFLPTALILLGISMFTLGGLARAVDPERGGDRDLIIAIGFSMSPGVLWFFQFLPRFGLYLGLPLLAWLVTSMALSAKNILGVSIFKAILFIAPGLLVYLLILIRLEMALA